MEALIPIIVVLVIGLVIAGLVLSYSPDSQARDENHLIHSLRQVFAVAEAYPQLKADHDFLELQKELINTEDRLQAARRFFNGNTREYNVVTESFPSNLVAQMFGFPRKEFFEIEDLREREPVGVSFTNKP